MQSVPNYADNQNTNEQLDSNTENMVQEQPEQPQQHQEVDNTSNEPANFMGMSDEDFAQHSNTILQQQQIVPSNVQETVVPTSSQQEVETNHVVNQETQVPEQVESTTTGSDYKQFFDKVTATFTANGKNMQVTDPNDIVRLMQMGLNYNKKMEAIKPYTGIVRTLADNNIGEQELSFLLDLHKKDPAAIAKLLKDANVDTYDLPDLEESPYETKTKVMSVEQAQLNDVLSDISNQSGGSEIIMHLGNPDIWDNTSLRFFNETPESLYYLLQDKKSGMYDIVLDTIQRDKALGKIPEEWLNKPRIELYEFIAQQITQERNNQQQVMQQPPRVVGHNRQQPNMVQQQHTAPLGAGMPTGTTQVHQQNSLANVPNILQMSDADFERLTQGIKFL